MIELIIVLALMGIEHDPSTRDHVDLIELNHFYDDHGRLVFDQYIFYDWDDSLCQFVIVDWRLKKSKNWTVLKYHSEKVYRLRFLDSGILRIVRSPSYRETWTQHDPELANREIVPKENRRLLTNPRQAKHAD